MWTCQISPSLLPLHSSPPPLQVLIPNVKLDYSHVKSRCGSLDRRGYSAGGGNVSLVLQVHCPNVSGCCVSVLCYFTVFLFFIQLSLHSLRSWHVGLCPREGIWYKSLIVSSSRIILRQFCIFPFQDWQILPLRLVIWWLTELHQLSFIPGPVAGNPALC